jgi:hypothetical protein
LHICITQSGPPDPLRTQILRNLILLIIRAVPGDGQLQPFLSPHLFSGPDEIVQTCFALHCFELLCFALHCFA